MGLCPAGSARSRFVIFRSQKLFVIARPAVKDRTVCVAKGISSLWNPEI